MQPRTELRPAVDTEIPGQGIVIVHEPVIQQTTGRFFGLYRLVVRKKGGLPDIKAIEGLLLVGAQIKSINPSANAHGELELYYKFEGQP